MIKTDEEIIKRMQEIKKNYENYVVFFIIGYMVRVIDMDVCIIAGRFNRKFRKITDDFVASTFSIKNIECSVKNLEKEKINNVQIDVKNDFKVLKVIDFEDENSYKDKLNKYVSVIKNRKEYKEIFGKNR